VKKTKRIKQGILKTAHQKTAQILRSHAPQRRAMPVAATSLERRNLLQNLFCVPALAALPSLSVESVASSARDNPEENVDFYMSIFRNVPYIAANAIYDGTPPRIVAIKLDETRIPFPSATEGDYQYQFTKRCLGVSIQIEFTRAMARGDHINWTQYISPHLTISPPPTSGYCAHSSYLFEHLAWIVTQRMPIGSVTLAPNTRYTISVSGATTDIYGYPFDGNYDGTGGTDFHFSFVTGDARKDAIPCQPGVCDCLNLSVTKKHRS
jgi:hypothetical protein